jgi:hypothetical protein
MSGKQPRPRNAREKAQVAEWQAQGVPYSRGFGGLRPNPYAAARVRADQNTYGSPQEWQKDRDLANTQKNPYRVWYGPEGPPGGPERIGYKMAPPPNSIQMEGPRGLYGLGKGVVPPFEGLHPVLNQRQPPQPPVQQAPTQQTAVADALRARNQ